MINEDSGEPVQCPFCSSDSTCEHLVVEIDRTFNECVGGTCVDKYDEIYDLISQSLSTRLKRPNQQGNSYEGTLKDIWIDALGDHRTRSPTEITIDEGQFIRLFIELCVEGGGVEFNGIMEEDSPGSSSSLVAVYAENPAVTISAALKLLRSRL